MTVYHWSTQVGRRTRYLSSNRGRLGLFIGAHEWSLVGVLCTREIRTTREGGCWHFHPATVPVDDRPSAGNTVDGGYEAAVYVLLAVYSYQETCNADYGLYSSLKGIHSR